VRAAGRMQEDGAHGVTRPTTASRLLYLFPTFTNAATSPSIV
jgi:hypothetical protein